MSAFSHWPLCLILHVIKLKKLPPKYVASHELRYSPSSVTGWNIRTKSREGYAFKAYHLGVFCLFVCSFFQMNITPLKAKVSYAIAHSFNSTSIIQPAA